MGFEGCWLLGFAESTLCTATVGFVGADDEGPLLMYIRVCRCC